MPGWIKLPRDIVFEPVYMTDKPYCDIAAYHDLLLLASHQEHELQLGRRVIQVREGEVITSQEKLARRWNWSSPKVNRYLKCLHKMRLIEFQPLHSLTRIRLCKWATY